MKKGHKPDFLAIANIGRALCGSNYGVAYIKSFGILGKLL